MAIKETPDLYCSLGEVTKDIQYFIKAIELSKGKSARAYRMLAKFQFHKEQVGIYKANFLAQLKTKEVCFKYADAIVNFEKSLEINCMQV